MNAYGTSLGGIPMLTEPFAPLVGQVEHVPWDDATALEKTSSSWTGGSRRSSASR